MKTAYNFPDQVYRAGHVFSLVKNTNEGRGKYEKRKIRNANPTIMKAHRADSLVNERATSYTSPIGAAFYFRDYDPAQKCRPAGAGIHNHSSITKMPPLWGLFIAGTEVTSKAKKKYPFWGIDQSHQRNQF